MASDRTTSADPAPTTAPRRPRGGLAGKRRAILDGALRVFARDGYTRASIDAISAEAAVSTRTIYNHFEDKAHLFRTVIQESATRAAEAQLEIVDRHLGQVSELEGDLVAFGLAWARPMATDHADHFSLVRQINAEVGHIPQDAIDAWQETGPLRVRRRIAHHLQDLADRGLLAAGDPERAALHLQMLVSMSNPSYRGEVLTEAELTEMVTSGVHAFLHGYLA